VTVDGMYDTHTHTHHTHIPMQRAIGQHVLGQHLNITTLVELAMLQRRHRLGSEGSATIAKDHLVELVGLCPKAWFASVEHVQVEQLGPIRTQHVVADQVRAVGIGIGQQEEFNTTAYDVGHNISTLCNRSHAHVNSNIRLTKRYQPLANVVAFEQIQRKMRTEISKEKAGIRVVGVVEVNAIQQMKDNRFIV
jgi:hypothetical protein